MLIPCTRWAALQPHRDQYFRILWLLFMVFSRIVCLWLLVLSVALSSGAAPGLASHLGKEVVRGYLVDLVCVKEEAGKFPDLGPNHTRKCLEMPACSQGGYAILLPSNQVLSFDQQGNELVRRWLKSGRQEKGIMIKATGMREGQTFHVLRIN